MTRFVVQTGLYPGGSGCATVGDRNRPGPGGSVPGPSGATDRQRGVGVVVRGGVEPPTCVLDEADTVEDRAVVVAMRRRAPGEHVAAWRRRRARRHRRSQRRAAPRRPPHRLHHQRPVADRDRPGVVARPRRSARGRLAALHRPASAADAAPAIPPQHPRSAPLRPLPTLRICCPISRLHRKGVSLVMSPPVVPAAPAAAPGRVPPGAPGTRRPRCPVGGALHPRGWCWSRWSPVLTRGELALLSWAGLRGAVPIVLVTCPRTAGPGRPPWPGSDRPSRSDRPTLALRPTAPSQRRRLVRGERWGSPARTLRCRD